MSDRDKDIIRLIHIQKAISLLFKFIEGVIFSDFAENEMMKAAIIRQFEIIGEAASNISEETKSKFPSIEWQQMKRFRNLLIHEYFRVDETQVWQTIKEDLPSLENNVNTLINKLRND